VILYEYPLNERIRTYLRLEHLFERLSELIAGETPSMHHYALTTMFEIMDFGSRADLKTEVLKDLDKQKQVFMGYRGNPQISEAALNQVIAELESGFAGLSGLHGRIGSQLLENEWLMSIRSRCSIPGGTCEFDLPAYYAWQHKQAEERRTQLKQWRSSFTPLEQSIVLLLKILRDSGVPQKVVAVGGLFQQNLAQGRSYQLLRMSIDPVLGFVPEISANRLVVSLRFMHSDTEGRSRAAGVDVDFEVALCL
jgi:cell division protein ZapD